MAGPEHGTKPRIEIGGQPLPEDIDDLVVEVVVQDDLHLPDTFMIRMRDPAREALKRAGIAIGSQIKVLAAPVGGEPEALIAGEVTALEAEFDATGSYVVVRGYDHSHRLHRGRVTGTYSSMTDADIARKIAQRAGLQPGQIDETRTVHDHLSQVTITDWEFLKARAAEIGYEVAVRDGKLDFRKPPESADAPDTGDLDSTDRLQLAFGAELEMFRPRVTSAQQVREVMVRGWDPIRKEAVVGRAQTKTTSVTLPVKPTDVAGTFGDPPAYVAGGKPLVSQSEVDVAASALAEQLASAFAEAAGIAKGDPKLKAGAAISVAAVGEPFEGRYMLSSTRHVYDASGYRTHFQISGRHDRSLLGLVSGGVNGSAQRIAGVDVAIVADVRDPEDLGRVKLIFPTMDDAYVSQWARVVQLGAGPSRGAVFLPEVGDEVLVGFAHGEVRMPFVIGSLYNGKDKPSLGESLIDASSGAVKRRGFISKKGHKVVFLDDDAKSGVTIATADDGLRIALKETGTAIRINSNGKVEIDAATDITIRSGTQLTLEGSAGVTIRSDGTVSVSGSLVKLN